MEANLLKVGYIVHIEHRNGDRIVGKIVDIRPAREGDDGYMVDYETRMGTRYSFNPALTTSPHAFYYRGRRVR